MAGVKSMCIRGIRSFGPDDGDEQRITFDKPLTLILGQNGCGKTTVIECLRYAVTGQMPPGSRNECFVYDAKVNKSSEVLAQVKLKFVNAKGKEFKISRSMQVTALQKKTRFQTRESFMSIIDDRGVSKDISSRCADLDFMIQDELGVSKAIINSVIFCHQEDSSWPLDEGKKVKDRFDEIFDADKYSDCFDRLRKIRKEYGISIKMLDQKVMHLSEKKMELDKKKLDAVNTEAKISEEELKMVSLTRDIEPVSKMLKAIETIQLDLVNFESKREKVKARLENCISQEEELKKGIKKFFVGPIEELQQNIDSYEVMAKAKQQERDKCRQETSTFTRDEQKTTNEISSNEVKFNKLMLLESQHQERLDQRNSMIVDAATLAEIRVPEEIESNDEAAKAINSLSQKVKSQKRELDDLQHSADVEEKKLQKLVDDSRDALSRHKQKIVSKQSENQEVRKEIIKLERDISDAHESQLRLETLEKKLKAIELEYQNALGSMDSEKCQTEINESETILEKQEHELEELNEKITKLQKQSAKLAEKDVIEEALKSKEKALTVLKNKHRGNIVELLGRMPERGFAMAINEFECNTRSEVDGMKKELKKNDLEVTSLEADRKHVRELLKGWRAELTAAEDKMYRVCGTQPYDQVLSKLNSTVDKYQEEQNLLQSSIFIVSKYKDQLKQHNSCPLCNRGFDAESEVSDLIQDLETKVMNMPAKLDKVEVELSRAKARKDELLELKSLNEKITTLKQEDIPQLEKRLGDLDTKLNEVSNTVEEVSMSLMEPEQRLQTAKQLIGDMPLLDRYVQEITTTTKELQSLKEQCSGLDGGMNLDEATTKQSDLRQKIGNLRAQIKSNQINLNNHTKKLQTIMQKKNQIKEDLLNIQKKVQEVCSLQEKLKQLESNKEKFIIELKSLQDSTGMLEIELKDKEMTRNGLVTKNRNAVDTKRNYIVKLDSAVDKIKAIEKEIHQHLERNVKAEMDRIKQCNKDLTEKKAKIISSRDQLAKKIELLNDELSKQEIYKRDLEDNRKLRKVQVEAANCQKEVEEINISVSGINVDMLSNKENLIRKQTQIFSERAQTEGSMKVLKAQLSQNKLELAKQENKDLEKQYREKFFELQVMKALDKDINDYSAVMDKCLMQFHKEKMENINLIIREMWRRIYRGNDIDYIEIKTEGNTATSSERRKYDYRVVQCKNGVEIDMRGRCSAGQKVLACLIIRLALAETFSARFGVLALDEPTTNLDHENVKSLCSALGEIVQERMRQKNFMFILITHDREFIEVLGNIDKVTHFYEVSRNEDGKSRIKKNRFQ